METKTQRREEERSGYHPWFAAIVAGLTAGTAMGLLLSVGTGLMPSIGALYGMPSFFGGWIAHLTNSIVFALVFAGILSRPIIRPELSSLSTFVGLGVGYGAFLGVVGGGFLFPLWVNAGLEGGLPVPFVPFPGLGLSVSAVVFAISHLVYGAILGPVYALTSRSIPGPSI